MQRHCLVGCLVIHLNLLHRVVRQVLQHQLVLPPKEVLAVQQQVLHFLAVDENLTLLVQLRAGHLTDERVEHRAVGHVEGIGIIHQRIAAIIHLYLRCRHHHLVECLFGEGASSFYEYGGQFEVRILTYIFQRMTTITGVIVWMRNLDDARTKRLVSLHPK